MILCDRCGKEIPWNFVSCNGDWRIDLPNGTQYNITGICGDAMSVKKEIICAECSNLKNNETDEEQDARLFNEACDKCKGCAECILDEKARDYDECLNAWYDMGKPMNLRKHTKEMFAND